MIHKIEPPHLGPRSNFFSEGMPLREYLNMEGSALYMVKAALFALANFLLVDEWTIKALVLLMALDTAMGFGKALRLKKEVSFKLLIWGMATKIAVLIIPITVSLLAKGLSFDFSWFVILILDVLLVSETFSIVTNILSIKQKKEIKSVDFVSILLRAIRTGLLNIGTRLINQIEKGAK